MFNHQTFGSWFYETCISRARHVGAVITLIFLSVIMVGCGTTNATSTKTHLTGAYAAVSNAVWFKTRIYVKDTVSLDNAKFIVIDSKNHKAYDIYYAWEKNKKWRATSISVYKKASTKDRQASFHGVLKKPNVKVLVVHATDTIGPKLDHVVTISSSGKRYHLKRMGDLPVWVGRFSKGTKITKTVGYSSSNKILWGNES